MSSSALIKSWNLHEVAHRDTATLVCTSDAESGTKSKGTAILSPAVNKKNGVTSTTIRIAKKTRELRIGMLLKSKYLQLCQTDPGLSWFSKNDGIVYFLCVYQRNSRVQNGAKTLSTSEFVCNRDDEIKMEFDDAKKTLSIFHASIGPGGPDTVKIDVKDPAKASSDWHFAVQFFAKDEAVEVVTKENRGKGGGGGGGGGKSGGRRSTGSRGDIGLAKTMSISGKAPTMLHAVLRSREKWQSIRREGADTDKLFPLHAKTNEYGMVQKAFAVTMKNEVTNIQRVENGFMIAHYNLGLGTMQKQVGLDTWDPMTMERLLFHGTQAVEQIVNSTDGHGFLPLLAGTASGAVYGDGTYFARDACYSNTYARTIASGERQMLAVFVAVGVSTLGTSGTKQYPLLPGQKFTRYNSLVNVVANPSIFVVQHSSQAYPAYLITYKP
eukprot:m.27314 g.27314  ORF g.27314 m.27314 type:complete len:439 (+) comp15727_c1_seq1:75-1391(+)